MELHEDKNLSIAKALLDFLFDLETLLGFRIGFYCATYGDSELP